MIPLCLIAKLFGKKLIYIESFAKVSSPTETGRFLYKFADRFYVQWKPMLQFYPKAIYLGAFTRVEERMIFITLGSQKFQFNRLLKAVDELVAAGKSRMKCLLK